MTGLSPAWQHVADVAARIEDSFMPGARVYWHLDRERLWPGAVTGLVDGKEKLRFVKFGALPDPAGCWCVHVNDLRSASPWLAEIRAEMGHAGA